MLQIDPNETQAHLGLAQCAVGRGQHDVAFEHFTRTAQLLRERGANDDALSCYGYAVSSDPRRIDIHVDIAELELEMGRREAALARLDGLAEAYVLADREDDAVAILEFMNELQDDGDGDAPSDAPEMFAAGAFEQGAVSAPIRDTEGTMVISTFLLTPDGAPFVPGAPPPLTIAEPRATARITELPTSAPRATIVPTAAPRAAAPRATIVPTAAPRTAVPPMGTPAPVVDDPSAVVDDPSAAMALSSLTEDPRWRVADPGAGEQDGSAQRRSANPLQGVAQSVHDEDSAELAALAVAPLPELSEPEIDVTAVRAKPLPKAAPAPSSVDAQGRSLAARLRDARSRAAAPTAPQQVVAAAPKPTPSPAKPAAATAKPTASTAKPTTATAKPADAPRPAIRTAPPIGAGTTRPIPIATKPTTTARASSAPAGATRPAANRPASPGKPAASNGTRPAAATGRPAAAASKPAASPRPTTAPATRPSPARQEVTVVARAPISDAPPRTSATPRPGAPIAARPTAPTPSRPGSTTSKPVAARPAATPTRAPAPSKPTATRTASPPTRAQAPAPRSAAGPRNGNAATGESRGETATKRVMAVRTRAPAPVVNAPGVPTAVGPARTLPLVIPPPPREELDDQNTVIFRGEP